MARYAELMTPSMSRSWILRLEGDPPQRAPTAWANVGIIPRACRGEAMESLNRLGGVKFTPYKPYCSKLMPLDEPGTDYGRRLCADSLG